MSVLNVQYYPNQDYIWHELGREAHLMMETPPVHEGTSQRPPLPPPHPPTVSGQLDMK